MKKLDSLLASGACKGSTTIPFVERPAVDRNNLGPFVRGYCNRALADLPFHDLEDIAEYALQQMIRDCVAFYWRNRKILEPLWGDPFVEYTEKQTGKDLFESRNNEPGFMKQVDPFEDNDDFAWDALHASAIGFGTWVLQEDPENETQLIPNFTRKRWDI